MSRIQAVSKHDGRVVAFEPGALVRSIAAAALGSGEIPSKAKAADFAMEIAKAIAEFVARECSSTPSTADLREMTVRILKETDHALTAQAYEHVARQATAHLFSLRVTDDFDSVGEHWDRRRLIDALRASQIAPDPAGEMAREVERRLIRLDQDFVSRELIHALAKGILIERGFDTRCFSARNVSVSFADQVPRFNPELSENCALPDKGPALQAFWLQTIHSPEVAAAVKSNALGLDPYPSSPQAEGLAPSTRSLDPQVAEDIEIFRDTMARKPVEQEFVEVVRLDVGGADNSNPWLVWPKILGRAGEKNSVDVSPKRRSNVRLKRLPNVILDFQEKRTTSISSHIRIAPAITLNVGGVLMREAIRDTNEATLRLSQLVRVAAQAHREREEYWGYSAARGRTLPVVLAGVWNAAAWLCGESYEQTEPLLNLRLSVGTILNGVSAAFQVLRETMGVNLILQESAVELSARGLWRKDREHFAKDGWMLNADAEYQLGLGLKVRAGMAELQERVDFFKAMSPLFDEPPVLTIETPLGQEPESGTWRELLSLLKQLGVQRACLKSGGSRRGLRLLIRQLREHMEGFPLFEYMR